MNKRVADLIPEILVKHGVDKVFLLSGGGMMHLLDGLARNNFIDIVCHHHEQSAGIAAEGYSRASGKIGVCYATSGPGATNIVTAVAGAWLDSIPMVFITGQSKVSQTIRGSKLDNLRQYGTFEIDSVASMENITKFSYFLDNADDTQYIIEKAIDIATSSRPGPVLIEIPLDIQGALIDRTLIRNYMPVANSIAPSYNELDFILRKWENAKRPLIIAGHGIRVSSSSDLLLSVAKNTYTPIVSTQLGKDIISYDNEFFVGHPGVKGDRSGNISIQNSDFILFIGTSIHVLNTGYELDKFAPNAYKIQVDCDRANFEREQVGVDKKVYADIQSFFKLIQKSIKYMSLDFYSNKEWCRKIVSLKEKYSVLNENHKVEPDRINIYHALEAINEFSNDNDIVVTDAGSAFYTVGQSWKVKGNQRVLTSGGFGAMGWALPAATGAALSNCNSVSCITGDGSLQTNVHALSVISGNDLNIKIYILNNNGYISIINTQNSYFNGNLAGVDNSSGVYFPDLKKLADSYKLSYYVAKSVDELENIVQKINMNSDPCIIDIRCNLHQEIIPTVSSKKLENGEMVSLPIDQMYPFLDSEELEEIVSSIT